MTYYTVKTEDISHNYKTLCEHTSAMVVPMLKANAYGLGAQKVLEILQDAGADTFALSRLEEAEALETQSTLWVLSCYHGQEELSRLIEQEMVFAVDALSQAKLADELAGAMGKTASVHLAVDTGFGRFGFSSDAIEDMLAVFALENIKVEGMFSHLGAAFFYKDDFADKQLDVFLKVAEALQKQGADTGILHIANSSATFRDKKFHLGAVRIGSALCGRLPVPVSLPLRRAGSLQSDIIDIRSVPKGQNIGYGKVYNVKRDTRVAILALGTAEGVQLTKDYDAYRFRDFCRYGLKIFKMMLKKDNRMRVTVGGKSVPVLGRVALTHMMIDVTDIDCKVGDSVTIPISPLYVADHIERRYE